MIGCCAALDVRAPDTDAFALAVSEIAERSTKAYGLDDLQRLDDECRALAAALGLDVPEVVFHFAPAERIYDIAARGLPGRYSHWRFGRDYEQMKLSHDHGRSRIYELVLNTQPYQAYLLEGNSWVAQLLVIAHVYGHCWFFQHNSYFANTDRKFLHRVRAGAERIEDYGRRFGQARVEDFVDDVQALAIHAPTDVAKRQAARPPSGRPFDSYGDLFPTEAAAAQHKHDDDVESWRARFPREPDPDLLGFILAHAPRLEEWQRDVVSILRDEAAYFSPQRRTKIANEGFAVWVHSQIVQGLQLPTDEFVEYDRLNASVGQPHQLSVNPYNLGYELWKEVERIYDHPTAEERIQFPGAGEISGRARVLELAAVCDDVSLIAQFLTPGVAERCRLFAWEREPGVQNRVRITTREAEEIRNKLVTDLSRRGTPRILVTDGDAFRKGALWLEHRHEGSGLDAQYAQGTLPAVARLWGRSVYLETVESAPAVTGAAGAAGAPAPAAGAPAPAAEFRPTWLVAHPDDEMATVLTERPDGLERRA